MIWPSSVVRENFYSTILLLDRDRNIIGQYCIIQYKVNVQVKMVSLLVANIFTAVVVFFS